MMQQPLWKTEAGPALVADVGAVQLVVKDIGGHVRFLVLRASRADESQVRDLVASGTAADVRGAMRAAEQLLGRLQPPETTSPSAS